ncbi:MAG: hypothetical protein KKD31_00270 [Bacteroidetes bacterium]|nr:hypothetical protein [Bacteroidota bacterium]
MLEFSKLILEGMSFNENLFMKELGKLIIWSESDDANKLKYWCHEKYGDIYGVQIDETFARHCYNIFLPSVLQPLNSEIPNLKTI